ncbi:MAG: hypothetical protein ABIJ08_01755 [Nanoarchaeota archaeon]
MFRRKSQLAMTDFFLALFLATLLLAIILFAWNRYTLTLNDEVKYKSMVIIASQTSDLLIKNMGYPDEWELEPENVQIIGLAKNDRNISKDKLEALTNLTYDRCSKLLGLELYEFYLELKNTNGTLIFSYGIEPEGIEVNVQRIVMYENEKSILEFAVWEDLPLTEKEKGHGYFYAWGKT